MLRPPSLPLPRLASLTPAPKPAAYLPYERIPALFTVAKRNFFAALEQAVPVGHQIFGQVRLANLIQVKQSARRDKSHWWRIQAKCLDFVLVDSANFAPRLVIELDDRSHDRADRRERDAFVDDVLASAGILILHVRWQRSYHTQALARQIAAALGDRYAFDRRAGAARSRGARSRPRFSRRPFSAISFAGPANTHAQCMRPMPGRAA